MVCKKVQGLFCMVCKKVPGLSCKTVGFPLSC